MNNGDSYANPIPMILGDIWDHEKMGDPNGFTKREAFAMAAMRGLLSNSMIVDSVSLSELEMISEKASLMADLQLKALEQ